MALFELALENNALDALYEEVVAVKDIFQRDNELSAVIAHPQITSQEKTAMAERIFKGNISDTLMGLLAVVIHKGREAQLIDIFEVFIEKYRAHKAVTTAEVVSAVELSDGQKESVIANLSKILGKRVELDARVDRGLIGGMRVMVDGLLIDGSIKKQMDEMKKGLRSIRLA
jgi:F-type H+-transporting ATPase subunit delta